MIKIKPNISLFKKHISEITPIIYKKIQSLKKRFFIKKDTIKCLKHLSNKKEIENILSANVEQLKLYVEFFKNTYPDSIDEKSELNKILRNIFVKEYDNWCSRTTYGAYIFVQEIDLKTCPYCNRNYTFTVVNKNGKMRPQIDHFYPKSKYPFFAMSFYNLIPSCPSCNHTKKEKFDSELINPYSAKSEDISFTYTPNKIDFIEVEKKKYNFDNFEIDIKGNKENIELFKLKELYEQHKDIVLELLIKKAYYPKSYIKELSRFGFSEDEIYRYLFSNYKQDKDLHKRPLSKLIKDISNELGII